MKRRRWRGRVVVVLVDSKKIQGEKSKLRVRASIYSLVNVFSIRAMYIKNICRYFNIRDNSSLDYCASGGNKREILITSSIKRRQ